MRPVPQPSPAAPEFGQRRIRQHLYNIYRFSAERETWQNRRRPQCIIITLWLPRQYDNKYNDRYARVVCNAHGQHHIIMANVVVRITKIATI